MDRDFLYGTIGTTLVIISIIAALVTSFMVSQRSQIDFEKVCVNSHRNVVYREIDGSLVSECK